MKVPLIPRHVWFGVLIPLVLMGFGIWRWWPEIEEYRQRDEREAQVILRSISAGSRCNACGGLHESQEPEGMEKVLNGYIARCQGDAEYAYIRIMRQPGFLVGIDNGGLLSRADRCWIGRKNAFVGFCAYPIKFDWRHRRTFICNGREFYSVENGGKPVTQWPKYNELSNPFTEHPELYITPKN